MKTNLTISEINKCLEATAKKYKTVSTKILLDKGSYRNVALSVDAESKGSKLASEDSTKLTRNVCDHVMVEFVRQVKILKGWIQMHDGKVFGVIGEKKDVDAKNIATDFFNNDKLCYCNREKPVMTEKKEDLKKDVKKDIKKDLKKDQSDGEAKPTTLEKELRKENVQENKALKNNLNGKSIGESSRIIEKKNTESGKIINEINSGKEEGNVKMKIITKEELGKVLEIVK